MSSSSHKKPNVRKGTRRLKLHLPIEAVDQECCRSESRPLLHASAPCDASRREKKSMAYSAPLGPDAEEDWRYKCAVADGDRDVVVNRLSLSVSDISYMRLNGCRAAVPTPSRNSLSYPHAHFGSDISFSTNPILFSSLHPVPALFSEIHGLPRARSMQEMINSNIPFYSKEDVEKSISEAQIADREEENDPQSDEDMTKSEIASNHPPLNASTILSTSQLKSSGSFNDDMTPLERKSTVTPKLSPRPSSSSSSKNFTPGVQPFSTWRFPVLGNVDSVATTLAHEGEDSEEDEDEDDDDDQEEEEEEERVTETKNSANKPPKKNDSVTNGGDHDHDDDNNSNNSNNGNKNNANVDVSKEESIDDDDDKNQSLLGSSHDQNHKKRFRLVYDIYESLVLRVKENNNNNNKLIEAVDNARRHSSPSWVHSTTSSTNIGLASGYYSLGSQWGLKHPNKQIVSHVSPLLHGFTNRHNDELQRSFTTAMDPSIVALIERRPLLQTTLFAGFVYRKINQQIKLKQRHSDTQMLSQPPSEQFGDNKISQRQEKISTEKEVNIIIGSSVAPKESSFCRSYSGSAAHSVSKEATGAIIMEEYTTGIPSGPGKLKDEPSPTAPHRALTQVRSWKSKVHTIDGLSRKVDNENDDLVVYVGMILMGWLEVVDLLGAGTFGQVFLCKDLRIVNRRFLHPSEIEGEDFQYWQCSHEYIPFSDPSMVPTHPPLVAVKVVKSRALFEQQSVIEAEMLVYIGAQTASHRRQSNVKEKCNESTFHTSGIPVSDPRCQYVAKIYAHGICYGHHCIVMERYGANLFEYVQVNGFRGLPMYHIQAIGRKILSALTLLHEECHVVHCDIKPENVLLTLDSCFSSTTLSGSSIINSTAADTAKITLESSGVLLGRSVKRNLMNNLLDASTSNAMDGSLPAPSTLRVHHVISMDKRRSISQSKGLTGLRDQSGNFAKSFTIPSLHIKLIDFSSSCYDGGNIHTYLQSRYYRAPEVILAAGYGPPIDIWSTGCLLAELLLGLPLLPGSCDYHQLYLIEEMLGPLPISLLNKGKRTFNYYDVEDSELESQGMLGSDYKETQDKSKGKSSFHLLNENEYLLRQENAPPVEWRCYFQYRTLAELVRKCMLSTEERRIAMGLNPTPAVGETTEDVGAAAGSGEQESPNKSILDEMMQQRFWLYDLLKKMLHGDPSHRITAREALSHTFFSHVPEYMKPFLDSEE